MGYVLFIIKDRKEKNGIFDIEKFFYVLYNYILSNFVNEMICIYLYMLIVV